MEVFAFAAIAAVAAAIVWAIRQGRRQRDTWQRAAPTLGLSFDAGPHSHRYVHARRHLPEMYGQHDGQDVYVGVRAYSTGSGKNRRTHYFTYVDVVFDPALKRGVNARRADGVSKFFGDVFGQRDIQIGHGGLDREFRIDGIDTHQIRSLIGAPEVLARLLVRHDPFTPHVTDTHVRLEATGVHVDPAGLRRVLAPAVELYRAVLAAWAALPPSIEEERLAAAWQRAAQDAGLAYEPRGIRARGRTGEVDARIELVLADKGWVTEIAAAFDPPLAVGFQISREGVLSGITKLFGAQDIKTGDRAFDGAFVVKGKDEPRVREILVDHARAGLLELLGTVDHLEVDDDHVLARVTRIIEDDRELGALLDKVTATGKEMVKHRRIAPVGPYR